MEGNIYCLRSAELFYVGSTKNDIQKRLLEHKYGVKHKNVSSKQIIEQTDYEIHLIEKCPLGNLKKREGEIIKEFKKLYGSMCVNKLIAGREWKERRDDEPEKQKEREKLYRKTHQEQIKKYTEEHKVEKSEYNKKYVAEHVELLEKNKQYHQEHKLEIEAKRSVLIECECGIPYQLKHKSRHSKTKRHLKNLKK
jgi:hypothetical protein